MSNFGRALRMALRYRLSVAASIVCALIVGLLWSANIGAIYPLLQVAFQAESLQAGVRAKRVDAEQRSEDLQKEIAGYERQLTDVPAHEGQALRAKLAMARSSLDAEQKAAARYRWLEPYIARYLPEDPFRTLVLVLAIILAGTIVKSVFVVVHAMLVARVTELGTFHLRKLFYRRTLRLDLATFTSEGTSDLLSRFTNDMRAVNEGVSIVLGRLVREPIKMLACLIGAGLICWRLLLLTLIVAPPAAWAIRRLAKRLKRANRKAMEEMSQLYSVLDESLRGVKVVKAFTTERHERKRIHHQSKKYFHKALRIAGYDSLTHPLTEMMGMLMISLALLSGAALVLRGETHVLGVRLTARPLDLFSLLAFYAMLVGATDPARRLSDFFTRLQAAAAASDRIFALLDREPRIRDPQAPRPLHRHCRDIVFERVSFAYQPGRPVLNDIDLRIRFGETIAVVGPSGCGKSTLANLILRFADPDSGSILLDGIPLPEVRLRDLRRQIGLVTQEPVLFDDTVLNNIRYGSPHATQEQIIEAARQAHAHRFIETELGDGYQTLVGPMGAQLSGGQRQRIALARAILRDPALLILDEATSQIDLESEQLIQRALEQFVRGRTAVIITHRLGALALADRIVVMQDGRIVDVGEHALLANRCELYRRLYQIHSDDLRESA
jgi:ATP-binding cassette subfamily B protein/subfamily B ATP-binding cassette protein MsbA